MALILMYLAGGWAFLWRADTDQTADNSKAVLLPLLLSEGTLYSGETDKLQLRASRGGIA